MEPLAASPARAAAQKVVVYHWSSCGAASEPRWFSSFMPCPGLRKAEDHASPSRGPTHCPPSAGDPSSAGALVIGRSMARLGSIVVLDARKCPQAPHVDPKILHARDTRPRRPIERPVSSAMCWPGNRPPELESTLITCPVPETTLASNARRVSPETRDARGRGGSQRRAPLARAGLQQSGVPAGHPSRGGLQHHRAALHHGRGQLRE